MVKHIVMWRLKPEAGGRVKEDNARLIKERLEALAGRIPGLLKIEVGFDFSGIPNSSEIALYSEFENREALENYMTHPEHVAVKDLVVESTSERRLADYETP